MRRRSQRRSHGLGGSEPALPGAAAQSGLRGEVDVREARMMVLLGLALFVMCDEAVSCILDQLFSPLSSYSFLNGSCPAYKHGVCTLTVNASCFRSTDTEEVFACSYDVEDYVTSLAVDHC